MKNLFFVCLVFLAGQFCFALDPAEGFWLSIDEKSGQVTAGWEIYESGGVLYGKMLSLVGRPGSEPAAKCKKSYQGFPVAGLVNQMPLAGTPWIFGLRRESEGAWTGGHVVNPEDGNMYRCKITRHGTGGRFETEALEMRGEIGLGIGRSQFWRRCTREEAAALR
ncbi:MAG: DUF2147 domain-containing protein [Treponema sp.]|jgi:uncharacterized protein (DUF2147 family)|nr:DUF2147 domain-containing protein [Treponema sp.]